MELLQKWPDAAVTPIFVNLLRCPDLDPSVHRSVWKLAWERDWEREPEAMREAVREWPLDCVSRRHAGHVILKLSEDPTPSDREQFLWAARQQDKAEFRCLGIRALHCLGEDSDEWYRMLCELVRDPDTAVRLAAAESLALMGDLRAHELIRMIASQERDDVARAEALRWLGENAPNEAVPYCRRVLLSSPIDAKMVTRRVCEGEALHQLARMGDPEALTVLLEAALFYAPGWNTGHLRNHLVCAADANGELPAPHHRCRYNRPYSWRCC